MPLGTLGSGRPRAGQPRISVVRLILGRPDQLGEFARYISASISSYQVGDGRRRDVLPLPVPRLPDLGDFDKAVGRAGRARRIDLGRGHAVDVWSWITVTALNYEYCGRQPACTWMTGSAATP